MKERRAVSRLNAHHHDGKTMKNLNYIITELCIYTMRLKQTLMDSSAALCPSVLEILTEVNTARPLHLYSPRCGRCSSSTPPCRSVIGRGDGICRVATRNRVADWPAAAVSHVFVLFGAFSYTWRADCAHAVMFWFGGGGREQLSECRCGYWRTFLNALGLKVLH